LSALCGISCVLAAACLFSVFSGRGSFCAASRLAIGFTRATATTTCGRTATRTIVARGTAGTALVFTRRFDSGEFATGKHVALVDPHLDTDDAVGGVRFGGAVFNVGTQRVKRYTTFAIPFGTCDFDTIQTASAHDLDALSTQTHGVLHGALHGTAEHDPLFKLLRDRVGDQLSIDFRLADFFDVHVNRHAHQ